MKTILTAIALLTMILEWSPKAVAVPLEPTVDAPKLPVITVPNSESMPPEILDRISHQGVASLDQAVLDARGAELRERLAKDPENPYLLNALATITFHQGGEREALALWDIAHLKDPNLAPPEILGEVQGVFALLAKGNQAEAEKKLAAAEQRFAEQPHFQLIRAEQAMRGRNFKAAQSAFRKAHELGPDLYVTALNLGRFYEFIGQEPEQTMSLYQAAAQKAPNRAEVWSCLGAFQLVQNQPEAALESLRRAKKLDPQAPVPEIRLAELSAAKEDFPGAEKWYRAALAGKLSLGETRAARTALGDVLLRLGKLPEARAEIETVLKQQELPPLIFALATIDEAEDKPTAAERGYRRVLQLMPGHPLAANNLAMLLLRLGSATDEALQLSAAARQAIPNNAIIESTHGCALVLVGHHQEGIDILEAAIRVNDRDPWVHYCLGKGLAAVKRSADARNHLQQVSRIDPNFPRNPEIEKLLGELH